MHHISHIEAVKPNSSPFLGQALHGTQGSHARGPYEAGLRVIDLQHCPCSQSLRSRTRWKDVCRRFHTAVTRSTVPLRPNGVPGGPTHCLWQSKDTVRPYRESFFTKSTLGGGDTEEGYDQAIGPANDIKSYLDPVLADREKEESMKYRRVVYDHTDWLRHRSSIRHLRHIVSIASSRVILALGPPVLVLTSLSFLVTTFNETVLAGGVLPTWIPLLRMSSLPFLLTAPALGLLLVFRTNASYARFLDARKLWGLLLNRTRDLTRQLLTWVPRSDERSEAIRHLVALPLCLKHHLRRGDTLQKELEEVLEPQEVEAVMAAKHRPLVVLQTLSEIFQTCPLSAVQRALLDQNVTQFNDVIGACERIYKTPIPLSYTRLTSRFLVIWHAALPLALWDQCHWSTIPVTLLSAAALFCIEEVGVLIEEPFSILPLDSVCQSARMNALDLEDMQIRILARRRQSKDDLLRRAASPQQPPHLLDPSPASQSKAINPSSLTRGFPAPNNGSLPNLNP